MALLDASPSSFTPCANHLPIMLCEIRHKHAFFALYPSHHLSDLSHWTHFIQRHLHGCQGQVSFKIWLQFCLSNQKWVKVVYKVL